jgi:hypothetical protein
VLQTDKNGAITVMRHKLSRISMVAGVSGVLAVGLTSGAYAATTTSAASTKAAAYTPAWRTILSLPNGTTPNQFDTVVATGKTTGWTFLNDSTVAYERTGATSWKKVSSPGGADGAVKTAGASSPSNVWAAFQASSGGTRLYHWNGAKWTLAKTFPKGDVSGVSVLGPADVWVFGGASRADGVFHFNGRTWTQVATSLQGGSALSDKSVWAFNSTQIANYNGRKWTATSVAKLLPPATRHIPSYLTGVIALAPNNVYATGDGVDTPRGGPGVVLHYNGHSWSRVAESGTFETGTELTSDGHVGLWIAAYTLPGYYPGLWHYSAGKLSSQTLPGGATTVAISRIPGTAEELSVGFQSDSGNSVVQQYS